MAGYAKQDATNAPIFLYIEYTESTAEKLRGFFEWGQVGNVRLARYTIKG